MVTGRNYAGATYATWLAAVKLTTAEMTGRELRDFPPADYRQAWADDLTPGEAVDYFGRFAWGMVDA